MTILAEPADLSHVETWIFDLDNTLYSRSTNLFDQIDARMTAFIARQLDLEPLAALALQKAYLHSHGTTLSGLMEIHGIEPHGFLDYVHDIDLGALAPLPTLRKALERLPGKRIVYTNGSRRHAERVVERLGLAHLFDDMHDIAAAEFRPKPHIEAYERLLSLHGAQASRSAMFEDLSRNLKAAHTLGITTVLVDDRGEPKADYIDHVTDDLAPFLALARVMSHEQRLHPGKGTA